MRTFGSFESRSHALAGVVRVLIPCAYSASAYAPLRRAPAPTAAVTGLALGGASAA